MKQKLIIELSEQATENYLKWLKPIHEHCAEADCEFPGFSLQLDVLPSIQELIYGKNGNKLTELGEVKIKMEKYQET